MKVLFIGHDASRTGAPILLLNLLKWLSHNSNLTFDVLLLGGGPLVSEYKEISKVYFWFPPKQQILSLKKQIYNRVFNITHDHEKQFYKQLLTELSMNNYSVTYGIQLLHPELFLRCSRIFAKSQGNSYKSTITLKCLKKL